VIDRISLTADADHFPATMGPTTISLGLLVMASLGGFAWPPLLAARKIEAWRAASRRRCRNRFREKVVHAISIGTCAQFSVLASILGQRASD
jgi:hypothetical protein